ncbi:hypothetical protein LCGC14_0390100 [marine sediment metagenome]|uniref:Uncharacterized protein n=1 Tax=marine sediment metagenome TaxID=412755 RepID=A0A0F9W8V3_9ZZZZ
MVPRNKVVVSDLKLAEAMRESYNLVFKEDPSAEVLAGGWAQAVHESGWPVEIPNNNIGNIKAAKGWMQSNNYFVKDTVEFTRGGKKYIEAGTKWRSYPTLVQGAAGYWSFLNGQRYSGALDWMAAGDPESASVVLGVNSYYTASIKSYAKRSNDLYGRFMKNVAPKMANLKSNPVAAPGEKLAIKNLASDYSDEEKMTINQNPSNDVDMLTRRLYAKNKLTKIVKNSILREKLPISDVLVCVSGDCNYNKLEYARVTASILKRFIDADVSVCGENNEVEIQCSAVGNEKTLTGATEELCKLIANEMNKRVQSKISVIMLPGLLSKYSCIKDSVLIKNRKHFNMNRILHG